MWLNWWVKKVFSGRHKRWGERWRKRPRRVRKKNEKVRGEKKGEEEKRFDNNKRKNLMRMKVNVAAEQ